MSKPRYKIERHRDDLYVYLDDSLVFFVQRKWSWTGRITCNFYESGKLILQTKMSLWFILKFIKILYQDLPEEVRLQKNGLGFFLQVKNDRFTVKEKYFSTIAYKLKANGQTIGVVKTYEVLTTGYPMIYWLNFDTPDDRNYYALIMLLLDMPVTQG